MLQAVVLTVERQQELPSSLAAIPNRCSAARDQGDCTGANLLIALSLFRKVSCRFDEFLLQRRKLFQLRHRKCELQKVFVSVS